MVLGVENYQTNNQEINLVYNNSYFLPERDYYITDVSAFT